MGNVTQYIGARYVPLIDGTWDNAKEYEPLTVVLWEGNSYTSRQTVPVGVDITNEEFWALTGNYNAQVEQYRQELEAVKNQLSGFDSQFNTINGQISELNTDLVNVSGDISANQAGILVLEKATLQKGKKAIFLGDSITYGQATQAGGQVDKPWPSVMGSFLEMDVTNIAVGGSTAASYDAAPSTALKQALSVANETDVDYFILMFGTNDYGYAVSKNDTFNGLKAAISNLQTRFQNSKVIGAIPPYMPGDTVKNSAGFTALDYKMVCRYAFESYGCPYIDFTDGLSWSSNNWDSKLMPWDKNLTRLHPTQEGYNEMGYYAANVFQTNGQRHDLLQWRDEQGVIPTFLNGASSANSQLPPLSWYDELTGYIFVDLGDGIKIPDNYSTSNAPVAQLDIAKKPYRPFYNAGVLLASETGVMPACLCINNSGQILPLGSANYYAGKTIIGEVVIPKPWTVNA